MLRYAENEEVQGNPWSDCLAVVEQHESRKGKPGATRTGEMLLRDNELTL